MTNTKQIFHVLIITPTKWVDPHEQREETRNEYIEQDNRTPVCNLKIMITVKDVE